VLGNYYFAYGANLDLEEMSCRCPDAVRADRAIVREHEFFINDRGVASIIPSRAHWVEGLLWILTADDEERLDRFEGVRLGLYRKDQVMVQQEDGQRVGALVYVATSTERGRSISDYLAKIIKNATRHGFSEQYIAHLRSLS
jgi:hypothetical protein